MKKISIILINYNGQENTIECLENLKKINVKGFSFEVILIDNFSGHRLSIDEKKYENLNLKLIFNEVNSGFSGGCNIGIQKAIKGGSEYILLLNNDTKTHKDFLFELFSFMEKNQNVGLVSPKIYFEKGYEYHKDKYAPDELGKVFWYAGGEFDWKNIIGHHRGVDEVDRSQYDTSCLTDFATGCCVLIRSKVFLDLGYFDEKYFLYYEDADFSVRASRSGIEIYYLPSSIIWHKNAGSSSSGSNLQDYYITRNRMYFGFKYAGLRAKIALVKESIKILNRKDKFRKEGILDFYKHRMGRSDLFK